MTLKNISIDEFFILKDSLSKKDKELDKQIAKLRTTEDAELSLRITEKEKACTESMLNYLSEIWLKEKELDEFGLNGNNEILDRG